MALLCAISGNVPEVPVVSIKSGHVFEKSLITKYVSETGKDPISGVELGPDDLLPLSTSKTIKPRAATSSSIPGLLGMFHDEWDALMLEHHALRQNLHTVGCVCVLVCRAVRRVDAAVLMSTPAIIPARAATTHEHLQTHTPPPPLPTAHAPNGCPCPAATP